VLFVTLSCAAIGFTDDYLKLRRRHSLGLSGRWKMVLLAAVTVGVALLLQDTAVDETSVYIPLTGWDLNLGLLFYPFLFLVIAGTVNGANLTDGIDGLASGTATIMLLTFLAIAGISWIRSGPPGDRSEIYLDLATLPAALVGGPIGLLWSQAFPTEVFMGDTGSMALGGAIAGFAIVTGTEILLVLIAGIYVIEVLSLIIQVVSFKRTGRRVFLMAPIHHHFEMKAWSETKIMVRFWIVCAILCATGFALFYRDFLQFAQR
jgi:phospho-N-acetylmuramoyl-pentapeptide-transferase